MTVAGGLGSMAGPVGLAKLAGLVGLVGLAGCARAVPAVPEVAPGAQVPTGTPISTPSYQVSGDSQREPMLESSGGKPLRCTDHTRPAIGFSEVQAATGSRALVVTVLNCTTSPLVVPLLPRIEQRGPNGEAVPVKWEGVDHPASRRVAAGAAVELELNWRSNGRCERGANTLGVTVAGSTSWLRTCLQLGGPEGLDDPDDQAARGWIRWQ